MNHDAEIAALKAQVAAILEAVAPLVAAREAKIEQVAEVAESANAKADAVIAERAARIGVTVDEYLMGVRRDIRNVLVLGGQTYVRPAEAEAMRAAQAEKEAEEAAEGAALRERMGMAPRDQQRALRMFEISPEEALAGYRSRVEVELENLNAQRMRDATKREED
jgi:hypothetical protein